MNKQLLVLALLWPCWLLADYGHVEVLEVVSVYDADTFRVNIAGWPDIIGANMPIRANGFDAPEIRGKCQSEKDAAQRARDLTVNALNNAEVIELRNMQRGKYFRIIADVYVDGEALKDIHLAAGTARPYAGGKRSGWCD